MAAAIIPASLLVVGTGLVLAGRLPLRGATERLSAALLIAAGAMAAILLLAGVVIRRLDPWLVSLLAALSLAAVIFGTRAHRPAVASAIRRRLWVSLRRAVRVIASHRLLTVVAFAVLAALVWRGVLALRLPVLDFDGLSYHLVTVDVWLQSGHIGRVPHRPWSDGYAATGELLTLWLMLFSNTDALARLTGLLPLPLAALATAGLCRELGATRSAAALAGLVVVALPAVILKADSTYVDNFGMAMVASGWFFGLAAIRASEHHRRLALYALMGIGVGLGMGSKASLIVPLGVIATAAGLSSLLMMRRVSWRIAAWEIAALVVPILVLGGYWYAKNFFVFGNPLWPFTFGPFPGQGSIEELIVQTPDRLAGMSRWLQIAISWSADVGLRAYEYSTRVGGFGLVWPVVFGLGAISLVWAVRRRAVLLLGAICLPSLLTLAVMPMPWWPRYTLFVAVLMVALAAVTLSIAPPKVARPATALVAGLALVSLAVAHRTANFAIHDGPGSRALSELVALVAADEDRRRDVGLWATCRGFDALPPGARVRTDGFTFLHLVVGPDLDRDILLPFGSNVDPSAAIALDGVPATHLALLNADHIAAARADTATFGPLGPVCRGVELFAVRSSLASPQGASDEPARDRLGEIGETRRLTPKQRPAHSTVEGA